ncbi:MAG: hypothetical protein HKN19_18515 [Halioglobus sp.]|nr:hypothetical protein [Halioglobus sp.]
MAVPKSSGKYDTSRSMDRRTRSAHIHESISLGAFLAGEWSDALARNGPRAAADASRLGLTPLTIEVEGDYWTLAVADNTLGPHSAEPVAARVCIDLSAFDDLVSNRKTAMGLLVHQRVAGGDSAMALFNQWDPVLRSVLDDWHVYAPGEIALAAQDGTPLNVNQVFTLDDDRDLLAHFFSEAGFLLLKNVLTDAELTQLDGEFTTAVTAAEPGDGQSWWAQTGTGEDYSCRVLNFARKSPTLQRLMQDERLLSIGRILGDGHIPGDSFGEHFGDLSAEALVKKVDSVQGLSCLPWHKDCERGGHTLYCCGITIGICLTPADEAHGGLDVYAGSHRANVASAQSRAGLDLPHVSLVAERGDVTVHLSCLQHRSTHPTTSERRVIYTGFTLPDQAATHVRSRQQLEHERGVIGDIAGAGKRSAQ